MSAHESQVVPMSKVLSALKLCEHVALLKFAWFLPFALSATIVTEKGLEYETNMR